MFTIAHRISHIMARSPVMRGLLAYGSAEAVSRVVRLASILIVARRISPEMLGTAALALSIFELVRVLANVGIRLKTLAIRNRSEPRAKITAIHQFRFAGIQRQCHMLAPASSEDATVGADST